MNGVEGILLDLVPILENMVMVCGVFCVTISKNRRYLVLGALLLIILCIGDVWLGYDHLILMVSRVYLDPVIMLLWTNGKIFRRLAIYISSIMYLHMFYLCIDLIFSGIFGITIAVLENYSAYWLMRGVFTVSVAGTLAYQLRKNPAYLDVMRKLHVKYFLMGSICCMAASLIQHYIEDMSVSVYGNADQILIIKGCMVIVSTMFYVLGVGVVVLDILRKKYQTESRLKDEYLQITREYVREVKENARETRKMHHDLQAHIFSLRHYLDQREYEKAEEYLSAMQNHTDKMVKKMISVNHEIVDAVLQEMQIRSEKLQIKWKVEGLLPPNLPIGDFDLCTIFSNLLANSVEACEKLPSEKRYICLEIRQLSNHLVIEITNPISEDIDLDMLGSITHKEDVKNHGYGIANVRSAVAKHHGELFFEKQEGIFLVRIMLQW